MSALSKTNLQSLPDELLREIVSPFLQISDEEFGHLTGGLTFARNVESNASSYLLISKRFLRLTTSLLWTVVVVRSKAQGAALVAALKENPDFGGLIRKFRVEGGWDSMDYILSLAPNIRSFALILNVVASDLVTGIVKRMPKMANVENLFILQLPWLMNKSRDKLLASLCESIQKWNLITFHCDTEIGGANMANEGSLASILEALGSSTTLEELHVGMVMEHTPDVRRLAAIPSLKTIYVSYRPHRSGSPMVSPICPRVNSKVVFTGADFYSIPERVLPVPVTAFPNVPKEVTEQLWSRILQFWVEDRRNLDSWLRFRIDNIYLVSKQFLRITIPLLLRDHSFGPGLVSFISLLEAKPELVCHVKTFTLLDMSDVTQLKEAQKAIELVPDLTAVYIADSSRYERGLRVTLKVYQAFIDCCGGKLVSNTGLHISSSPKPVGTLLQPLVVLQRLKWSNGSIKFTEATSGPLATCLPSLQYLWLEAADTSFMKILTLMDLPALDHLKVTISRGKTDMIPFVKKHGGKIQHLEIAESAEVDGIFQQCTNLVELGLLIAIGDKKDAVATTFLDGKESHHSLKTICVEKHNPTRKSIAAMLKKFEDPKSGKINVRFSGLESVKIMAGDCHWAVGATEREIKKNPWIKMSDELLENTGVKMADKYGKFWRPRLK